MFRFRRRKRIKKQVTDEGIVVYTTVAGKKLVTGVMSPLTQKMEKERRVRRAYAGFWGKIVMRLQGRW